MFIVKSTGFFLLAVLVAYSSNSPPLGPLSICGFLYFTLKCLTYKRSWKRTKKSKQKQRLLVSVSLGLYSGLSLEHKRLVKKSLPCLHPVQHRHSRSSVVLFVLLFFCFCDFSKQSLLWPMTVVTYTSWWARYPVADTINVQEERKQQCTGAGECFLQLFIASFCPHS